MAYICFCKKQNKTKKHLCMEGYINEDLKSCSYHLWEGGMGTEESRVFYFHLTCLIL